MLVPSSHPEEETGWNLQTRDHLPAVRHTRLSLKPELLVWRWAGVDFSDDLQAKTFLIIQNLNVWAGKKNRCSRSCHPLGAP